MNKLQKEIWRDGLENVPANLLRAMDTSVYQSWVFCAYAQRRAFEEFHRTGEQMLIVLGNGSVKANPLLTMIRNEGAQMLRLASEMGFTPTARMRVKPDDDDQKEANPFDQFTQGSQTSPPSASDARRGTSKPN
jgi:P27 family predicted phage terminase small subunit